MRRQGLSRAGKSWVVNVVRNADRCVAPHGWTVLTCRRVHCKNGARPNIRRSVLAGGGCAATVQTGANASPVAVVRLSPGGACASQVQGLGQMNPSLRLVRIYPAAFTCKHHKQSFSLTLELRIAPNRALSQGRAGARGPVATNSAAGCSRSKTGKSTAIHHLKQ